MNTSNWAKYHEASGLRFNPRKPLLFAVNIFTQEGITSNNIAALDLGFGNGSDTIYLLQNGWRVTSIDSSMNAAVLLCSKVTSNMSKSLSVMVTDFRRLKSLPISHLVNASFSLPFLEATDFYHFWKKVTKTIMIGGRFAGTFFGINDDWSGRPDMTFLSMTDLLSLFNGFEIEYLSEVECDEEGVLDKLKHWHKYYVVARKLERPYPGNCWNGG